MTKKFLRIANFLFRTIEVRFDEFFWPPPHEISICASMLKKNYEHLFITVEPYIHPFNPSIKFSNII